MSRAILHGVCASFSALIIWFFFIAITGIHLGFIPLIIGLVIGTIMYNANSKKESKLLAFLAAVLTILTGWAGHTLLILYWTVTAVGEGNMLNFIQMMVENPWILPVKFLVLPLDMDRRYFVLYLFSALLSISKLQASRLYLNKQPMIGMRDESKKGNV